MLDIVFKQVLKWEKEVGVTNDPDDMGGVTNDGITWEHYHTLALKVLGQSPTLEGFNNLSEADIRAFYTYSFEQINCHRIENAVVAAVCFDFAKNSLYGKREMQRLLKKHGYNLRADNVFGDITIAAINSAVMRLGADVFIARILECREAYVRSLVARKTAQKKFLKGWLNRITDWRNWAQIELEKQRIAQV